MSGLEKFTQRARRVLSLAHQEAEQLRHNYIGTEHLLLGLIREEGGVAARVLRELGLETSRITEIVKRLSQPGEEVTENIDLSPGTQEVLQYAIEEAEKLGNSYVSTEHLLLGLIRYTDGIALNVLRKLGVTPEQIRRQTRRILQSGASSSTRSPQKSRQGARSRSAKPDPKSPMIDQLATDLTSLAEEGKLDPVIGRQMEIERVIQILARRTKNNPALMGEPGVGKTAIVEGLAQRIIEGDVPALLLGKQVLRLDVGSLVAGTMYRGQFEERLKKVIDELKISGAILFIDEVHMLVGAGAAGSSVDAANILKPALSRGELQVIGATTLDEYRKHIESDAALERRFQPILVEEPTVEETIDILKGVRSAYEDHHRLNITDEALEAAAQLSSRYVTERFLPDKAIDLIDESGSRVRMYKSPAADKAKELTLELKELKAKQVAKSEEENTEELDALNLRQEEVEAELEKLRTSWDRETSPSVTEEDIAELVAMWTGIPVMQIAQEETDRLLHMEEDLGKVIVGQEEAIVAISKAVRRARAGMKDPARPIGSFVFLGPTGVGKTELTKALAKLMFGSEEALIQLDMSEFMERHSVSRLVGAPPGYVGYEEAGQLTEALRRRPYSIVVFDEIEKAHPEAHNMLLQIMEEGHLSDARGRKVDFRNAIIVMTSNVGADMIMRQGSLGFNLKVEEEVEEKIAYRDMRKKLTESLRRVFRPEFINRVDSVIVFRALTPANIQEIVSLELKKVAERLVEHDIRLQPTDAAVELLAELGYDREYGARPLKRIIQQKVEDALSDALLGGEVEDGDLVILDIEMGEDAPDIIIKRGESEEEELGTPA
ncbi:MAG: ATP-dependent Clp protease ATP-binding subunit [Chloroflexi bacterium]|nr:ATP-dependent Clp protease ATP-binding subunit [Chloroflexota bacterium]MBT3670107.1 ATP-dependent Clp protease ATP-binding subunit [Chloroflexota bacterium]MBT4001727.1 ATP-dependent Clp protease ATP-binding subunit [Chloroflexota bacterium]MBT4306691.1 ATP-dependent Clp protease ATP-binding subunit [Chloroflexota bacterium]MBT4532993.1 ATP-dependent Clp protease ATP-binding subunit [Chloroflexota bacterium]